jgi:transposase InsO family protein
MDSRKNRWGVEPICRALQFAPSTYYATLARPICQRRQRDDALRAEIHRVHHSNCDGVYGAKKVWKQLNREGVNVAHCTVRRIMKSEGLSGARRGRQFKITTTSDENQHRPSDLVDRQFVASAPNRLWVADLTYVKTHSGWVYLALIIDVSSRSIVG